MPYKTKKTKKTKPKLVKEKKLSLEHAMFEIVAWLYVNDGSYSDKNMWRDAFIKKLIDVIKRIK